MHYEKTVAEELHFKKILDQETKSNSLFGKGWGVAKTLNKPSSGLSEEQRLAVITYTLETPQVYSEFNRQTRELGAKNPKYQFKAMHYFLTMAIEKLSAQSVGDNSYKVFRGVTYHVGDAIKGQQFSFTNFASTSTKLSVAMEFLQQSKGEKTLFVIESTKQGAKIKQFSKYPGEEEVLVPPCEKFKVTDIKKIQASGITEIYLKSFD